jgi:heat shock protein HslJ
MWRHVLLPTMCWFHRRRHLLLGGLFLCLVGCASPHGTDEAAIPENSATIAEEIVDLETQSSPLTDTRWVLTALHGQPVLLGTEISLTLEENRFGGSTDCNAYGGSYNDADGTLIWSGYEITLSACVQVTTLEDDDFDFPWSDNGNRFMEQEKAYMSALVRTTSYHLSEDNLELYNVAGELTLLFMRWKRGMQLPGMESGTWRLISFIDGEAITSPLAGTEIMLEFEGGRLGSRGLMMGTAGCNNYQAHYENSSEGFTVVRVITTDMNCDEPDGVIEQEAYFLNLLAETEAIRLDAHYLRLRTGTEQYLHFGR